MEQAWGETLELQSYTPATADAMDVRGDAKRAPQTVASKSSRVSASFLYAFLLDENAMHLASKFPVKRTKTVADLNLRGANDDRVIDASLDEQRIVVTSNRDDYVERYRKRIRAGGRNNHTDLNGLVIFSGDKAKQLRQFGYGDIETKMGRSWRAVFEENLLVRVRLDGVDVEAFERCPYCTREGIV